jgi:hypothetical protein
VEIRPHPDGLELLTVEAPEYDATFEVCGVAPVQGSGSVCGRDLYFRARHDQWSFDVADRAGHLPSDGYQESDGFYREAEYLNASYMPHREAVAIIETCLREYRCTFGNPLRPVTANPSWLTSTVVAIARGIRAENTFAPMPVLADTLQDAGCDNEDILAHCRDPQPAHVRGCWVVDLGLGKN